MQDLVTFLNVNSGAFSALATLIVALATIAIACFSFGTWRLWRREQERDEALHRRLASASGRASGGVHSAAMVLDLLASGREEAAEEEDEEAAAKAVEFMTNLEPAAKDMAWQAIDLLQDEIESVINQVSDPEMMSGLTNLRSATMSVELELELLDRVDEPGPSRLRKLAEKLRELDERTLVFADDVERELWHELRENEPEILSTGG